MAGVKVDIMRGQTIWDIAIQKYGSIEAVFSLVDDNADQLDSLNDDLTPGQVLRVVSPPADRDVATYYADEDLHPVSGELVRLGGAFSIDWDNNFDNQIAPV